MAAKQKPPPKKKGPRKPEPPKAKGGGFGKGFFSKGDFGSAEAVEKPTTKVRKEIKVGNLFKKSKTDHLKADNLKTEKPKLSKPNLGQTINPGMAEEKNTLGGIEVKGTGQVKKGKEPKVYKQTISATAKGSASVSSKPEKNIKEGRGTSKVSSRVKGVGSSDPPHSTDQKKWGKLSGKYFVFLKEGKTLNIKQLENELAKENQGGFNGRIQDADLIYVFTLYKKNEPCFIGWAKVSAQKNNQITVSSFIPIGGHGPTIGKFFNSVIFKEKNYKFSSDELKFPIIFQISENEALVLDQQIRIIKETLGEVPEEKTLSREVRSHGDAASLVDHLERKEMAAAFSERLQNMWFRNSNSHTQDPYVIHLNAPWGAGKTTFFNLLRDNLRALDPKWTVVDFNAWQHQHMDPPWWNLLQEVYQQSFREFNKRGKSTHALSIWGKENWRRARAGKHAIFLILLGLIPLLYFSPKIFGLEIENEPVVFWKNLLAVISAFLSLAVLIHGTLLGGSSKSAKLFSEVTKDPQNRLKKHFQNLTQDIEQPILVFIDDIDRCKPEYVVALLEGIMTIFRSNRCIFLIAGDAYWIQQCFEKIYEDFKKTAKNPGKTLGHNFLEKVFQFSLALPPISDEIRNRFLKILLGQKSALSIAKGFENEEATEKEDLTKEEKTLLKEYHQIQETREEALSVYTLEEADEEAEHLLMQFALLIEPNPRAMKRLVNAYVAFAITQVSHKSEGLSDDEETKLALWTILTQRWPVLIEHFVTFPHHIPNILAHANGRPLINELKNSKIEALFKNDQIVRNVLKGDLGNGKKKFPFKPKDIQFYLGLIGD